MTASMKTSSTGRDSSLRWRDEALCRQFDPELWFPSGIRGTGGDQWVDARAICHDCPVIADCLAWVTRNPEPEGMFAGLTPEERDALKREERNAQRRKARQVACSGCGMLFPTMGARRCSVCEATREVAS